MNLHGLSVVTGLILASLALPAAAQAQDTPRPWQDAAQPLTVDEGQLSGPGADWLSVEMMGAQSVLVGEQHGVEGLARLTAALEAQFQPDVLVLEAGPWIGERITQDGIRDALAFAPYSLAFDYNGDIALIEQFQSRTGEAGEVWGVDQEANAIHPYAWLAQNGEGWGTQRTARGLHLKAALNAGEYIRTDHFADLERLRAASTGDGRAQGLIDTIETSMTLFTTWRSGARGQSSAMREQYMIDRFDTQRSAFEGANPDAPRTLLKMGGAHVMEGEDGPNGVMTLGEHIQRRANSDGVGALHLGLRGFNPETTTYPIADLIEGQRFLLIDTAVLRTAIEAGQLDGLTEAQRADINGFDALIYINPLTRPSKSEVYALQADFRNGLYTQLGVSFWPVPFVIILTLFGLGLTGTRAIRGGGAITGPALTLTGAGAVIAVIFALQILALVSGAPGSAALGSAALAYLAPTVALVALADTLWRGRGGPQSRWITGLIWASLLLWLGLAMHHWNFGAMLA